MGAIQALICGLIGGWALIYGFLVAVIDGKGAKDATIGGIISALGGALIFLASILFYQ